MFQIIRLEKILDKFFASALRLRHGHDVLAGLHRRHHRRARTHTHLPQLLMDTQVVHHHDPVHDLQQRLVCNLLIGLLERSPQQQAVVAMTTLDFRLQRNRKWLKKAGDFYSCGTSTQRLRR